MLAVLKLDLTWEEFFQQAFLASAYQESSAPLPARRTRRMIDDRGVVLPGPETDRVDCPTQSMHEFFDHTRSSH